MLDFTGGYTYLGQQEWLQEGVTLIPTILIPVSEGEGSFSEVTTDALRIKLQGSSRSYSGQTNVENLQVFGETVLNYSPAKARVAFEKKRQYSRLGHAHCRSANTGYCGLGTETTEIVQEQFDCCRVFVNSTYTYRQIIGVGRSGAIEWSQHFENSHLTRKATISWKLSGNYVTLEVRHEVVDPDNMLDGWNVEAPTSLYRNRYYYGHYYGDIPVSKFRSSIGPHRLSSIEGFSTYEYHRGKNWVKYRDEGPKWSFRVAISRAQWADCAEPRTSLDLLATIQQFATSGLWNMAEFESIRDYQVGQSPLSRFDAGYFQLPNSLTARDRGGQSVFSELQEEAINQNRYINTNFWMFIQDLANAQEDWANLYNQFKADGEFISLLRREHRGSLKQGVQLGANTYLPLLYGWRLTQSEAEQLGQQIVRLQDECRLASEDRYLGPMRKIEQLDDVPDALHYLTRAQQTFAWSATIRPEPNAFSSAFAFLDERSLYLTTSDAWDWIPYSFVVNWFDSTVGDATRRLDFRAWKANYFPLEVTRSYRLEACIDVCELVQLAGWQTVTPARVKYYWRDVNKKLDPPGFHTLEDSALSRLASHWCEATALIVQRL
jgi:hypothetical protein